MVPEQIGRIRRAYPGDIDMPAIALAPDARPVPIPVRELLPWAIFAGLILLLAIYFVGVEEGATSLISGIYVHEFVHDGRHLLAFPCH
jgi:Probable cobalt transporter subunit (CbtB)